MQLCCCVHLILYLTFTFYISLLDDIRICKKDLLQLSQVTIYFKVSPKFPAPFRSNLQKSLLWAVFVGPLSCFWKQVPLCSYYAFKFYGLFLNYMLISKNVKLRGKVGKDHTKSQHCSAVCLSLQYFCAWLHPYIQVLCRKVAMILQSEEGLIRGAQCAAINDPG